MSSAGDQSASEMATIRVPIKIGSVFAPQQSPTKRGTGITVAQKQALIDNLQLEITERARKLRATYNVHAQSLRTRVEIRVNRIPLSLRKVKMGDLVLKHAKVQDRQSTPVMNALVATACLPPVPAKDYVSVRSAAAQAPVLTSAPPTRTAKRPSDALLGRDKENEVDESEMSRKKMRSGAGSQPVGSTAQVLSPASSNRRAIPRGCVAVVSSEKSLIARPMSPVKTDGTTSLLSNMVEKARSTRAAATARKGTAASTASSTGSHMTATRSRKGVVTTVPASSRVGTLRTVQRASGTSESSDGSTSTVVRKKAAMKTAASRATGHAVAAKRTVMSTIRKGVAGTMKAPTAKPAPGPAMGGNGRVLRKRG